MVLEARFFCRSTLFIPCMPMILDSSGKGLKWGVKGSRFKCQEGKNNATWWGEKRRIVYLLFGVFICTHFTNHYLVEEILIYVLRV